jgi:hypothetical protein
VACLQPSPHGRAFEVTSEHASELQLPSGLQQTSTALRLTTKSYYYVVSKCCLPCLVHGWLSKYKEGHPRIRRVVCLCGVCACPVRGPCTLRAHTAPRPLCAAAPPPVLPVPARSRHLAPHRSSRVATSRTSTVFVPPSSFPPSSRSTHWDDRDPRPKEILRNCCRATLHMDSLVHVPPTARPPQNSFPCLYGSSSAPAVQRGTPAFTSAIKTSVCTFCASEPSLPNGSRKDLESSRRPR